MFTRSCPPSFPRQRATCLGHNGRRVSFGELKDLEGCGKANFPFCVIFVRWQRRIPTATGESEERGGDAYTDRTA